MNRSILSVLPALPLLILGCEEKKPATPPPAPSTTSQAGHNHDAHGTPIDLGSATIGAFEVKAIREEGAVKPGGEVAIDVTVTGAQKPAAVRFWVGTQDAAGSVKAKASIEDSKEPNRWHTHAEVPDPLPAGSMLWVEVEDEAGAKSTGSFDLKA